jgi:hypothetical protein
MERFCDVEFESRSRRGFSLKNEDTTLTIEEVSVCTLSTLMDEHA